MERIRKPLQGVTNIVRFNWPFYVLAAALLGLLVMVGYAAGRDYRLIALIISVVVLLPVLISLLASWYVYDLSGLYQLHWIETDGTETAIVNIHAGFDETSRQLQQKFANASLTVLDFYDPVVHTEPSIKRARQCYPAYPGTIGVKTNQLPLGNASADKVFVILSAHEIRNEEERIGFFRELQRITRPGGSIYITEHLRDLPNFLVYNIGFFHFYAKRTWKKVITKAGCVVAKEIKNNPFMSTFILHIDGTAL